MKTYDGKEDVDIRGRNGFWQQKTSIIIFALLSICLLVTATLSVTFIVLYATRDSSSTEFEIDEVASSSSLSDVCQSSACLKLAAQIKDTINEEVDPCENFESFACFNWAKFHVTDFNARTQIVMCQNPCIFIICYSLSLLHFLVLLWPSSLLLSY